MERLLEIRATQSAMAKAEMPAAYEGEHMNVTRRGITYTLRIVSRVNATMCWAVDQYGDRWRVLA